MEHFPPKGSFIFYFENNNKKKKTDNLYLNLHNLFGTNSKTLSQNDFLEFILCPFWGIFFISTQYLLLEYWVEISLWVIFLYLKLGKTFIYF